MADEDPKKAKNEEEVEEEVTAQIVDGKVIASKVTPKAPLIQQGERHWW